MEEQFFLQDDISWREENAYYSIELASKVHGAEHTTTIDSHAALHESSRAVNEQLVPPEQNRVLQFIEVRIPTLPLRVTASNG